jgi:hypothetical protein
MNGEKWVNSIRNFHLTAKQINQLPEGSETRIVCFDRNFCDYLFWCKLKEGVRYKPASILNGKNYTFVYKHGSGLKGQAKWLYEGSKKEKFSNFEFDVEYKPRHWYPLKNRVLGCSVHKDKITTDLEYVEKDVRVGWRGPCILETDVKNLPDFFL